MHRTGLKILQATVGIQSNTPDLLPRLPFPVEVKSLLTDFRAVSEIPFSGGADGQILLTNKTAGIVTFSRSQTRAALCGPLIALERRASDPRFSLWGNQGFLYRFSLYLLEKRHSIFSLHACGLSDEKKNVLYVIAGGAGSGKTVFLLSGLLEGLKLFSTETVHFKRRGKDLLWFKGSLIDNVRLGTLLQDFPEFMPRQIQRVETRNVWQTKIALDLSASQSEADTMISPRLIILFPRIEAGRKKAVVRPVAGPFPATRAIFDNISQKIAESFLLYDQAAIPGFDDGELARARGLAASGLIKHPSVRRIASVLSSPARCWGNLLEGVQRKRR